jgi:hypothetical protein
MLGLPRDLEDVGPGPVNSQDSKVVKEPKGVRQPLNLTVAWLHKRDNCNLCATGLVALSVLAGYSVSSIFPAVLTDSGLFISPGVPLDVGSA